MLPPSYGSGYSASEFWNPVVNSTEAFYWGKDLPVQSRQYAMRSPLFSGVFYCCFSIGRILGLDYHGLVLPLVKMFMVAFTSTLPVGAYWMASSLFRDRRIALSAAVWAAVHHKLVVMGSHTIVNSFVGTTSLFALCLYLENRKQVKTSTASFGISRVLLLAFSGQLLGLSTYVRCDQVISLFFFFLFTLKLDKFSLLCTCIVALGFLAGLFVGGAVDMVHYGYWFASPIRWFLTNVWANNSSLYGELEFSYYFRVLFVDDKTTLIPCVLAVPSLVKHLYHLVAGANTPPRFAWDIFPVMRLLLTTFGVLYVYSHHGHKEVRFVHDCLVFAVIAVAALVVPFMDTICSACGFGSSKFVGFVGVLLVLVPNVLLLHDSSWIVGTHNGQVMFSDHSSWTDAGNLNRGILDVGKRADVTGLILQIPENGDWGYFNLLSACGWTCLHHQVPISMLQPQPEGWTSVIYTHDQFQTVCAFFSLNGRRSQSWVLDNKQFNYAVHHDFATKPLPGFKLIAQYGSTGVFEREKAPTVSFSYYDAYRNISEGRQCEVSNRHSQASYVAAADVDLRAGGNFFKVNQGDNLLTTLDGFCGKNAQSMKATHEQCMAHFQNEVLASEVDAAGPVITSATTKPKPKKKKVKI